MKAIEKVAISFYHKMSKVLFRFRFRSYHLMTS
jgi:hypothetical protein